MTSPQRLRTALKLGAALIILAAVAAVSWSIGAAQGYADGRTYQAIESQHLSLMNIVWALDGLEQDKPEIAIERLDLLLDHALQQRAGLIDRMPLLVATRIDQAVPGIGMERSRPDDVALRWLGSHPVGSNDHDLGLSRRVRQRHLSRARTIMARWASVMNLVGPQFDGPIAGEPFEVHLYDKPDGAITGTARSDGSVWIAADYLGDAAYHDGPNHRTFWARYRLEGGQTGYLPVSEHLMSHQTSWPRRFLALLLGPLLGGQS